ncbi:MAG: MFS transporter [Candidatus Aenigmarchaeota archaeon]|nr:MFS transporter [Candidatus Aenigmarchaeota archaeon]
MEKIEKTAEEGDSMKLTNLAIFTLASSIGSFASGLLGPFYVVYVQQIGGSIQNLGIAFGLLIIAQSFASYFVGKYSDVFGRKPFLIVSGYVASAIILTYTLIRTVLELYVLQIFFGITNAIYMTVSIAFLGDATEMGKRGLQIGKYRTVVGVFAGFSMIIGGMVIGKFGFQIIFYVVSLFFFIATSLLFLIKERRTG